MCVDDQKALARAQATSPLILAIPHTQLSVVPTLFLLFPLMLAVSATRYTAGRDPLKAATLPYLTVARGIHFLDCEVPTPSLNLNMGSQVEGNDLGANTHVVVARRLFGSSLQGFVHIFNVL